MRLEVAAGGLQPGVPVWGRWIWPYSLSVNAPPLLRCQGGNVAIVADKRVVAVNFAFCIFPAGALR